MNPPAAIADEARVCLGTVARIAEESLFGQFLIQPRSGSFEGFAAAIPTAYPLIQSRSKKPLSRRQIIIDIGGTMASIALITTNRNGTSPAAGIAERSAQKA
jgi:hypothetical protein